MSSSPLIRRAEKTDKAVIASFNMSMALETEQLHLDAEVVNNGVTAVFEKPEHGYYLVAEIDGRIAACMMLTFEWSDWRNGQFWWIQSVYVQKEFRRRGLFRSLYNTVLEKAKKDKNCVGLRLYVEQNNEQAISTYKSLEMTKTAYNLFEINV